MSDLFEQNNPSADQHLRESFQNWDVDSPREQLWAELDESLSIASVWSKIDEELETHGSSSDKWITDSFDTWFPAEEKDGWLRMENELSRERIWRRLSASLNQPIQTAIPWLQRAAAVILFVFTSFFINDMQPIEDVKISSTTDQVFPIEGLNGVEEKLLIDSKTINQNNQPIAQDYAIVFNEIHTDKLPEIRFEHVMEFQSILAELNSYRDREIQTKLDAENNEWTDLTNDKIVALGAIQPVFEIGTIDYVIRPKPVRFVRPIWSLELGTQLSILTEANRQSFSSTLPKFGVAADIAFHRQFGRIKLAQSFGFSQYAQSNGKYLNGRYSNTEQNLNTIQATSTIGFEHKKVTVFGGLLLSRLINGTEQSQAKITNVYDVKSIQIGIAAGFDVRVKQFRNGNSINLGVQYQWTPSLKSENTKFENIQGVRFQTKFLF